MSGRAKQIKLSEHYRTTFGTASGKVVLKDILENLCGHGTQLWAIDQLTQNANCVRHDVGQKILDKMKESKNETD
jgi:hypothetical protein